MDNNKYQRGKIYKIISTHTDKIYIGSTIELTLAQRLAGHKRAYKQYLAGKHRFVTSFELLQHPEYKIVLIESYPCNTRDELLACEQRHIDMAADNCVNRHKAYTGLSKQEYRKQYMKIYCDENKAIIAEYNTKYRAENKVIIAENKKQWYEKNKKQKIQCECGSVVGKSNMTRHQNGFIHTEYIKMLN